MALKFDQLINTEIMKPARYLGNEVGAIHKDWHSANIRWVLTYPEVYEVGASNLGHIILYNILNAQPRQLCDRTYLPAPDLSKKLRDTDTPLFALESKRDLKEFDILGFSLSYELGSTNILEMLDLAQIPLTWQERKEGNYPLIFAGGQTATSNPEPYADFFDFFALGDGEELLPEIGFIIDEGKKNNLNKEELLLDLAQIPGVYVPRFYDMTENGSVIPNHPNVPKRVLRRVATPIPAYSIGLVPYIQTVHDRLTVEIRRGCTRGCRFCQPGMLTRPATDVEPDQVINAIENGMRATGYNEFSLLSLSCSDYLALPAVGVEIRNRLKDENISLSLPSQRVDRFDENIANIIGGIRKTGLTFAPEAGTQRMRDVINKGLTNEQLLRGVKTAVEQGWEKVKLYFMIGLPGETDLDVLGIVETIEWLRQECRMKGKRRLDFNITISNFTPKPHTPFQWHSVSTDEFIRKQDLLRTEFYKLRGIKVNYTDVRISAMEDFLGRGDRRLASVVRRAWELGAGMDSWWENVSQAFGAWEKAIDESGLTWKYRQVEKGEWNVFEQFKIQNSKFKNSNSSTGILPVAENSEMSNILPVEDNSEDYYAKLLDAPLPWDHINTGIDKQWLKDDLQRALEATTIPDCAFDGCSHCGVCGTDFGHNVVYPAPPIPTFEGEFQRDQERVQRFRVRFGKLGDMRLVSHLDLVRLFERVVRRASIPVAFTNGFHPSPRISIANALSLGATSSGEIIDFELRNPLDIDDFTTRLKAQLPQDMPVYEVEEVGVRSDAATKLLEKAEYLITVENLEGKNTLNDWQNYLDLVNNSEEIRLEKISKSGKVNSVNLCDRLFSLTLDQVIDENKAILRYTGSCRNDGTLLTADHVVYMLNKVTNMEFHLLHIHREKLILENSN